MQSRYSEVKQQKGGTLSGLEGAGTDTMADQITQELQVALSERWGPTPRRVAHAGSRSSSNLQARYSQLESQHAAALVLLGEREEELQFLRAEFDEVKEVFRAQVATFFKE